MKEVNQLTRTITLSGIELDMLVRKAVQTQVGKLPEEARISIFNIDILSRSEEPAIQIFWESKREKDYDEKASKTKTKEAQEGAKD